ncbi:hypothetical protein NA78x_000994 [Anatilimnocola sp. NA78]|uniref:hypothetical protein n=1 Tax=Anatilimnocola sp. NA78 TaxID=3415683 RepID=UPI003CE4698F
MSHLVSVVFFHACVLLLATLAGALLIAANVAWENWQMNVRSRVQRRFVKRELSLPQTMAAATIKAKAPAKLRSLRMMAKTAR